MAVVLNFSQTWALYCLVQFYSVTKEKLDAIQPLAKFLTFKSIVFLTWWQGIIIAFLFSMGVLKGRLAQELQARIQDYIICIEVWLNTFLFSSLFFLSIYAGMNGHCCSCLVDICMTWSYLGTSVTI